MLFTHQLLHLIHHRYLDDDQIIGGFFLQKLLKSNFDMYLFCGIFLQDTTQDTDDVFNLT